MKIEGTWRKTGILAANGIEVVEGTLLRYRHPQYKYRNSNKVFEVKLSKRLLDLIGEDPDKVTQFLKENNLHAYSHISIYKAHFVKHDFYDILKLMYAGVYKTGKRPQMAQVGYLNLDLQYYKGVPLRQIDRKDYHALKARRFVLNDTNQNVWIPNAYLQEDGTLKTNINIDFVFRDSKTRFKRAGISELYKQFSKPNN